VLGRSTRRSTSDFPNQRPFAERRLSDYGHTFPHGRARFGECLLTAVDLAQIDDRESSGFQMFEIGFLALHASLLEHRGVGCYAAGPIIWTP
jgi:hypothetical protein